jgi:hypothetical protein
MGRSWIYSVGVDDRVLEQRKGEEYLDLVSGSPHPLTAFDMFHLFTIYDDLMYLTSCELNDDTRQWMVEL